MQTPSNFCYNVRRKGEKAQNDKDNNKERTKKMAKEIKIGDWFYRMMGYGGSESQWCCVIGKTEEKTGAHMFSLFGGKDGGMRPLPVSEVYIAIDERGIEHRISANDLKENGSIGIGSLEADKYGHRATICREDARLLVETGAYTEEEIAAEFPYAFKTWEEEEKDERPGAPMTAKQVEIYRAVKVANEEKQRRETEERNRKFREAVEALRKRYSYIPCPKTDVKYLRTGEVSRNLKAVLKHEFPGVKFSVTSDSFSGGDSATVKWEDGPTHEAVNRIVDAFQINRPDYTGDYWDPVETATTAVCGGFSYTHAERSYSEDTRKFVTDFFNEKWPKSGYDSEWKREQDVYREVMKVLSATDFPVGGYEIEGIEYDEKKFKYVLKVRAKAEPIAPPPSDPEPNGKGGKGVEVKENTAKGGLEIYFPAMPSEAIRDFMKSRNWRWSKFSHCWWHKDTEEARNTAAEVVAMYNKENGRAAA